MIGFIITFLLGMVAETTLGWGSLIVKKIKNI